MSSAVFPGRIPNPSAPGLSSLDSNRSCRPRQIPRKGIPFRDAYRISGSAVAYCIENGLILEDIPLEKYKSFSEAIDTDVYEEISLENCVKKRIHT